MIAWFSKAKNTTFLCEHVAIIFSKLSMIEILELSFDFSVIFIIVTIRYAYCGFCSFLSSFTYHFLSCSLFILWESEQDFISSAPNHVVFNFIIQSLIGLIQVEYQSKSLSPFHTHPISMRTFFAAISIYSMGLLTKMELQTRSPCYSKILGHVILISGVLCSASLASTLLPHLLIISVIVPIMLTYILCIPYKHMYRWIVRANSQVCKIFNRFLGCYMMQQQDLPM